MTNLIETFPFWGIKLHIHQERAYAFDAKNQKWLYRPVGTDQTIPNMILDGGRRTAHKYIYGTTPRTNGFNWIALSGDATNPSSTDTTLAGELVGYGLARSQATVLLPTGDSNQTVLSIFLTYTGIAPQTINKVAVFDAPTGGNMNHEILIPGSRLLFTNDTLTLNLTGQVG